MESNLFAATLMVGGLAFLSSCGLNNITFSQLFTPTGWRKPDLVIHALTLEPGAQVADIGAGDGYFTFRLADAVGSEGHVYAVEVTDKLAETLRQEVERRGYKNVTVVRGGFDDPMLPDRRIDVAFFSGVFHHIDARPKYFTDLKNDLTNGGRVVIIDGAPDPLHKVFMPFHFASAEKVDAEMQTAGYERTQVFDFLPMMNFQVFEPRA